VEREQFLDLAVTEVAELVRSHGPKVCVFPVNGTRRWYLLEHPPSQAGDSARGFLEVIAQRHIELYRLIFDHGVHTLLTPAFGPDIWERGQGYVQMAAEGLAWLATHPDFIDFYREHQVRVRFYGDYRKFFVGTTYAYLADLFDEVTAQTLGHEHHRLFFGLFAHDATETIAELAVEYYAQQERILDKRTLVELYYGEYVEPVDLFIGFDKLCVFDMPLVATGNEDLYFTVSPSPYLGERQLREILYDHLYARRDSEPDYEAMAPQDWAAMRDFYQANLDRTLGVGARQKRGGYWYPLPQVELPASF
jgi:tuberculosinol/isotuberculosinol synthase